MADCQQPTRNGKKSEYIMSDAPKTITVMEATTLLEHLLRPKGTERQMLNGIRNYTIGLLMLDAGLRVGEVVGLKLYNLTTLGQPATAVVITKENSKNGSERTIPLTSRVKDALALMLKHWWTPSVADYRPAFYRISDVSQSLTCRQIQKFISDTAEQFIGRKINPHVLRHTFATRLMRTTNARTVQVLLGHKKLSSTQVYLHPNMTDLNSAIERIDRLETDGNSQQT